MTEEQSSPAAVGAPSLWSRVWRQPEVEISDFAFSGELLVAGLRLLLLVALLYFPIRDYLPVLVSYVVGDSLGPLRQHDLSLMLSIAGLGLLGALAVYATVHRNRGHGWIGFASSLLDVSLVSAVLLIFLALGKPVEASSDAVIFCAYLLVIGATTLRYDARISLITGVLALGQYAAIVLISRWSLVGGAAGQDFAAGFSGWVQTGRLIELAVATLLAVTVVVRSSELRQLSTCDRFTGLSNRAVFDERLERESLLAQRTGERFAVAMVDIDHFKRFNDEHSHAAGDDALRRVAQLLRQSCRASDVVARYGGDELALILPGARRGAVQSSMERIRRKVSVMPIRLAGSTGLVSVTVSIGVANWPEDGMTAKEVLACADRRLYQAKQRGRDQVVGPPAAAARPLEEQEILDLDATWVAPLVPPDP